MSDVSESERKKSIRRCFNISVRGLDDVPRSDIFLTNKNKYANSSSSKNTATTSKNTDKDDKNQNDGNPSENNVSNTKVGTAAAAFFKAASLSANR